MVRYPDHLVRQARRLVISEGLDYSQTARRLGVHNSAVSVWCRGLANFRLRKLVERNEAKRAVLLESEKRIVNRLEWDSEEARILCAIIYGCEGAKYPASNGVSLTNSDPGLVNAFVVLMRKAFVLDETKWRVHLQIHSDQDFSKLKRYWGRLLVISEDHFFKPTVTHPRGGKHRNEYLGTCSVRYGDYRIQLKLAGIFSEFLRKSVSAGGVA